MEGGRGVGEFASKIKKNQTRWEKMRRKKQLRGGRSIKSPIITNLLLLQYNINTCYAKNGHGDGPFPYFNKVKREVFPYRTTGMGVDLNSKY